MESATMYPLEAKGQPVELVPKREQDPHAHTAAFFESIRTGKKPVADINIGATAALTAILGREAIHRKKVMNWSELGVEL